MYIWSYNEFISPELIPIKNHLQQMSWEVFF